MQVKLQMYVANTLKILPSLKIGSAIKVYVTKFKKEIMDFTMGVSIQIVTLMNADSLDLYFI